MQIGEPTAIFAMLSVAPLPLLGERQTPKKSLMHPPLHT